MTHLNDVPLWAWLLAFGVMCEVIVAIARAKEPSSTFNVRRRLYRDRVRSAAWRLRRLTTALLVGR